MQVKKRQRSKCPSDRTRDSDLERRLGCPAVAVGDTVLIDAHAGLEVKDGDQTVHIIREADILAIVE